MLCGRVVCVFSGQTVAGLTKVLASVTSYSLFVFLVCLKRLAIFRAFYISLHCRTQAPVFSRYTFLHYKTFGWWGWGMTYF